MAWEEFTRHFDGGLADHGLTRELAELLPETTDDLSLP